LIHDSSSVQGFIFFKAFIFVVAREENGRTVYGSLIGSITDRLHLSLMRNVSCTSFS
jgi:hypothetical protein